MHPHASLSVSVGKGSPAGSRAATGRRTSAYAASSIAPNTAGTAMPDTWWDVVALRSGSYQDCALTGMPAVPRKYGMSGARDPQTRAAGENGCRSNGSTAAGWESVNGIE